MPAAAIVGAAVVGAVASANASSKAAKAQRAAADTASRTELEQYYQTREDMQPWREAGTVALSQLGAGTANGGDFNRDFTLADFQRDPGYQFRMDQGRQALERSAAARGVALSGGSLKALTRYGQDYASGEYQNAYNRFNNDRTQRFNRLASLANVGQTATTQLANMGAQTANSVANNITSAGNARASGYVGGANALNGAIGSATNGYFMNQYLNRLPNQTADVAPTSMYGADTGVTGGFDNLPVYG